MLASPNLEAPADAFTGRLGEIYGRMERVVPPVEWRFFAPDVALKSSMHRHPHDIRHVEAEILACWVLS